MRFAPSRKLFASEPEDQKCDPVHKFIKINVLGYFSADSPNAKKL
jgi:hypothetical protein